jgi:GTPase
LHVVDASAPAAPEHTAHVLKVLAEIGAAEIPQLLILNKVDRLPGQSADFAALGQRVLARAGGHGDAKAVGISALTGLGIEALLRVIDDCLPADPVIRTTFRLHAGDGATLALLHEFGRVLQSRYEGEACVVEAEVPASLQRRLARQ